MPILGIIASGYVPVSTFDYATIQTDSSIFDSTDGTTWTFKKKLIDSDNGNNNLTRGRLAYVNNTFYAANNQAVLFSSTNGTNWSVISDANLPDFNSLIYQNSKYYAASNSQVGTSTDGITWSYLTLPISFNFDSVNNMYIAYGNSTFVVVGDSSSSSLSSTDGITWTSRTFPSYGTQSSVNIFDLKYINTLFIAVGSYTSGVDSSIGFIATSTDGVTWTSRTPAATGANTLITKVAYGNSKYVVTHGNSLGTEYSTNGITWSTGLAEGTARTFYALDYGSAAGFAAQNDGGDVWRSTDGIDWSSSLNMPATPSSATRTVLYQGGTYYFTGNYSTTNGTNIYTSTNLTSFTSVTSNYPKGVYMGAQMKYINDKYFVYNNVNSTKFSYSTDLTTWTNVTPTFAGTNTNTTGIAYGNSIYAVFAGTADTNYSTSTDLVTWTTRTAIVSTSYPRCSPIYANSLFVTPTNTNIYTSTDAVTWTLRTSNISGNIGFLGYMNNTFVACGTSGSLSSSTDGITWTSRTTNLTTTINTVGYGNGLYIGASSSSRYATSTDLVTWTSRSITSPYSGTSGPTLVSPYYDGTLWYMYAGNAANVQGLTIVYTSTDGITWSATTPSDKFNYFNARKVSLY